MRNQRALVIGVSDYPNPADRLPAVAADVREMAKVLSSKKGTFPAEGVTVLADAQATRATVMASLKAAFSGTTDTVFVYLAGHGFESGGRYYFVTYDTDVADETTAIPLTDIKALFDQTKSARTFLWLDFCHAGGILARGSVDEMKSIRREIGVVSGEGRVIVAACTSAQSAYESPSIGHGFFTHALLQGLRGEAKSAQGEVTALSLYEFIDHKVANSKQQPVFFGETKGRIVLMNYGSRDVKAPKPPAGKKTSAPSVKGTWVMIGDDFFAAESIRNHSSGSIELDIVPQTGEQEAALANLRPTQFGGAGDLNFAANNDAFRVRAEQITDESTNGKRKWIVKLKRVDREFGSAHEINVQGLSPDEIARRRAGRILLNDPPAPATSRSIRYDNDWFVEGYISGSTTGFEIDCVIRAVYRKFGQLGHWKDLARLKAVFLLKAAGIVEHVLELKIGAVRVGSVSIDFRGRRAQQYSNAAPATIELKGKCSLE